MDPIATTGSGWCKPPAYPLDGSAADAGVTPLKSKGVRANKKYREASKDKAARPKVK